MNSTPTPATFSKDTSTETLLALWENAKGGLSKVSKEIDNGTFHTAPDTKGAAPPSQSGQLILWLAMGIDIELTRRGVEH
jgi:hypothetical protein